MEPTLRAGDVLVVVHGMRPRPGRLVVVQLPDGPHGPRPLGIKRATHRRIADGDVRWWVASDNAAAGTDSRTFGAVPASSVVALGLLRLPRWGRREH